MPRDIYALELWEYNLFMKGYENRRMAAVENAILTGYYTAYYMNAGKKAKSPDELMRKLERPSESLEEGFRQIAKFKAMEEGGKSNG